MQKDPTENSNWKFGIFFYDPDNKKVFVPKRFGIGWTLNFARVESVLIIGLLVIILLFSIFHAIK